VPRAVFIVEDGVDDFEFFCAFHRLREEGFECIVASHSKYSDVPLFDPATGRISARRRKVKGKHGSEIEVDASYKEVLERLDEFDVLVVPGGRGPERARRYPEAVEIARRMFQAGKPILAICHGPQLLASAGVLRGRKVTAYWGIRDDMVNAGAEYVDTDAVRDGNLVTVRHPSRLGEGLRLFTRLLREKGLIE